MKVRNNVIRDYRSDWGLKPKDAGVWRPKCRCGSYTSHGRTTCYECLSASTAYREAQIALGRMIGDDVAARIT